MSHELRHPLRRSLARALALAIACLALLATIGAEASRAADIRTAINPHRRGDLVKTIPISKEPWQQARSAVSLSPAQLGPISPGKVIEAASDMEITICIRPNPRHPGKGQPCIGNYYDYDPNIRVKLVLAPSQSATSPAKTIDVSPTFTYECTERPGHRTRHCTQQVPWSRFAVPDNVADTCRPCYLNLLVSAYHPRAGGNEKVVLGSSDDSKRVNQGRSQLSAAVFPSKSATQPLRTWKTRRLVNKRPNTSPEGAKAKEFVVYSQKIKGSRPGDQLLVEARPWVKNKGLPYPTHQHYEIIIAKKPGATNHVSKIAERIGPIATANGFTCTQNSSGQQSPCGVTKTGIVSVRKAKPFFINLVVGQEARGTAPQARRWKPSDRTRMLKKGFMRVRRYQGTMSCKTCALTRGFVGFSPASPPDDSRVQKLVAKLRLLGIDEGAYNCWYRDSKPRLVCRWRAEGRIKGSPRYVCDRRAFYGKAWKLLACKEEIGALLWGKLVDRGDDPYFAGSCKDAKGARLRCSWSANHGSKRWCKGSAVFALKSYSWSIDACRPERRAS